ncbi:MAG TPA: acyltransferase [Candidatus Sulfotelmatobacter sp.]|nr:acyltransferase [Candidatus Sulfotelmatobacter sp.]
MKPGAGFYRPELDCLRFFAFFAVFIYHTLSSEPAYYSVRHVPFSTLIASAASAGRFGVDLFFLLSAYLITELLLREQEQFGRVELRSFYLRRILRIWPLYFLGILIAVLLPLVDSSEYFPLRYGLAFVLMSGNWLITFGLPAQSLMMSLWSVSFEEQFYLLWSTFISRTRHARSLLYASGGLFATATLARLILLGHARAVHSEVLIFTNTLTRLDPLALGIATAVLLRKKQPVYKWITRLAFLIAGCALWLAAGHSYSLTRSYMLLGYPAMAVGAWLIFLSALGLNLAPRWLRYLGKISYGLYVFHDLALYIAAKAMGGSIHSLRLFLVYWSLGLLATIIMAALSYQFLESPFLRLKERFTRVKSRPV